MPAPIAESSEPRKTGRPQKYKEDYHPKMVYKLSLLGLTDDEMSSVFEINQDTFNRWKKKHPEFYESLTRGKTIADAEVAASFHQRAIGYQHPETKFFVVRTGKDKEEIQEKQVITHYPPETKAAAIWLSNRTKNWKERQTDPAKPKEGEEGQGKNGSSLTFTIIDPKTNDELNLDIGGADEETI